MPAKDPRSAPDGQNDPRTSPEGVVTTQGAAGPEEVAWVPPAPTPAIYGLIERTKLGRQRAVERMFGDGAPNSKPSARARPKGPGGQGRFFAGESDLAPGLDQAPLRLAPPPAFGLNGLKTYMTSPVGDEAWAFTTFGADGSQLQDAQRLGVTRIRQFGERELHWKSLAGVGADGRSEVAIPVGKEAVEALVETAENASNLRVMLELATAYGHKSVLTFLNLGGGQVPYGTPPYYWDPDETMQKAVSLNWDGDHVGKTEGGANFDYGDSLLRWRDWNLHTLDPRNEYKVIYLGYIAASCARVLVSTGVDLAGTLLGIEIINELNARCIPVEDKGPDSAEHGKLWAKVHVTCVRAMRYEFDHAGIESPAFFLAGISSPSGNDDPNTFSYRVDFLKAMVDEIRNLLDGTETLSDFVGGLDYHWYRDGHTGRGPLAPASDLIDQLGQLRAVLDEAGLSEALLTLFETGASSDPNISTIPRHYDSDTFQAAEVWRRLGAAWAGGADVAGWHPWTNMPGGSDYQDMGLRVALDDYDQGATALTQKRSWMAYSTFTSLLGACSFLEYGVTNSDVYVLSFQEKTGIYPYRYLVFLDPNGPTSATIGWRHSKGGPAEGTAYAYHLPELSSDVLEAGSTWALPYVRQDGRTSSLSALGHPLRLSRSGDPAYIILSSHELVWDLP